MAPLDSTVIRAAEALADANPKSMIAVFEPKTGNYLYASPSHQEFMGYKPDELLGRSLREFIHSYDLQHTMLGFMDAVLHGKSIEIGVRLIHKSGRPVRVRASATHILDSSGADFMLGRATPVDQ